MRGVALASRALLRLSGEDARNFLHGLITVDTLKLEAGQARYGALLSPQGKFLHDFFLFASDAQTFWLDTDAAHLPPLRQRLMLYRLRARLDITPMPEWKVLALPPGESVPALPEGSFRFADPRLPAMGERIFSPALPSGVLAEEEEYERLRLRHGIPEGFQDLQPEKSLILEYGLDRLHAVDFDKGCYIGQEVTARMRWRASLRKYVHRVQSEGGAPLPPCDTPVLQEGKEIGAMRSSHGDIGLALLSFDAVQNGAPLTAGNVTVTATLPAWAT